jgi:hypothetical protein
MHGLKPAVSISKGRLDVLHSDNNGIWLMSYTTRGRHVINRIDFGLQAIDIPDTSEVECSSLSIRDNKKTAAGSHSMAGGVGANAAILQILC